MRGVPRFNHHFQFRRLHRGYRVQALMRDLNDISAAFADLAGDVGQHAGTVGDLQVQPQQAAVAQQVPQQHIGQDARVDVAAGDGGADLLAAEPFRIGQ